MCRERHGNLGIFWTMDIFMLLTNERKAKCLRLFRCLARRAASGVLRQQIKQYYWELYRCCPKVSTTMEKSATPVESFKCINKSIFALCFQDHGHSSSTCLWNGRTANFKLWAVKLSHEQQQYQCQQFLL